MNALVPVGSTPAMTVSDVERVAMAIAKGGLFGSKEPNAILTLCLLAQAEGQHPAVVFRDYHIIQGKPAKKAEAMLRDFITSGGKIEWHTLDDTCADATFSHPAGSVRIEWTLERAKKAGISTQMWSKYPRQMLRSRVISEGVRTVFPGATSGLYVPEEVSTFEPKADEVSHDPDTGEVIEAQAVERQKVPGIHKIKERLSKLRKDGDAATTLDAFNALIKEHKDDLKTIRDANHEWWTGDGEDFEGYSAWKDRRKAELTPKEQSLEFQLLLSTLLECKTMGEYQNWIGKNGDVIDQLDGAESREFEALHDAHLAKLRNPEPLTVGEFGG